MKKYFMLLLPMMAILLSACSKGYSLEMIDADYVTNTNQILKAEGEKITIKVSSTHSYVMTALPAGSCEFVNNGVVKYSQEGVAIIDLEHEVLVNPNTTGEEREVQIIATQRHNPEIVSTIIFRQLAQGAEEE